MTPVQYKVGRFFWSVSLIISQNQNIYFKSKCAVEAAKSNHLSSLTLKSAFGRFGHKDAASHKTEFFATLFLANEVKIDQNN